MSAGSTISSAASQHGCDVCQPLRLDLRTTEILELPSQKVQVVALRRAAEVGCLICVILNRATEIAAASLVDERLDDEHSALQRRDLEIGRDFCAFVLTGTVARRIDRSITFEVFRKPNADFDGTWELVREQGIIQDRSVSTVPSICPAIPVRLSLPPRTDDPSHVRTIHSWLNYCRARHTACPRIEQKITPSRLLEVISQGREVRVRLHVDGMSRSNAQYIALSHCWGKSLSVPKTKKATLHEHITDVPYDSLSKTFRDAIQLTARLGFNYIWIDSLCIVQDDPDDWTTESAQMGAIYENASLVISAVSSTDSSSGLYHKRICGHENALLDPGGREVIVRTGLDHTFCRSLVETGNRKRPQGGNDLTRERDFPLMYRKWGFQERILGRRVVFFNAHELLWECREEAFCECGRPNGQPHNKPDRLRSDKIDFVPVLSTSSPSSLSIGMAGYDSWTTPVWTHNWEQSVNIWHMLVNQYTKAELSYPTDILPAFSGLARKFDTKGLGKYSAGLWEEGLPLALCWYLKTSLSRQAAKNGRPKEYCAPSWSWASVFGAVHSEPQSWTVNFWSRCTVEIISVHCSLSSSDPFGRVRDENLIIEAPGLQATVATVENEYLDRVRFQEWKHPQWCIMDSFDDAQQAADASVWIACLCRAGNNGLEIGRYLILRDADDGRLRRIGLINSHPDEHEFEVPITGDGDFSRAVENAEKRVFSIV